MLVGGKLEPGESPHDAALREAREEVGLSVTGLRLVGRVTAEAANEPGQLVTSTVFTADLPGTPVAAAEIVELRWMGITDRDHHDLAPLLELHVLPALRNRCGPWP